MQLRNVMTGHKVGGQALLPESIEVTGFPITLAFSKDGRVFLSERIPGRLWQIDHGSYRPIATFPVVPMIGHHETGLIGIALDPDFEDNGLIYSYYTTGRYDEFRNRVVRLKEDGSKEEVLLDNIPAGFIHNGGIMAFGPDKNLCIGVGVNNEEKDKSQDTGFLGGKVLRITRDGAIPEDNPFPNSPVYSYGHRNIFGLAFHPRTGNLYICDVGPDANDELNIIRKGANYGWPIVVGLSDDPRFVNPIHTFNPVITPTQSVFVGDDLYLGSYNEGSVHKLTLQGANFDRVARDDVVYQGRPAGVIGVFHSPDDNFYMTTPNRILRFTPGG